MNGKDSLTENSKNSTAVSGFAWTDFKMAKHPADCIGFLDIWIIPKTNKISHNEDRNPINLFWRRVESLSLKAIRAATILIFRTLRIRNVVFTLRPRAKWMAPSSGMRLLLQTKKKRQYWSILGKYLGYFYSSCQFIDCLLSLVFVDFTTANKSWIIMCIVSIQTQ